jgi:ribosome-associated protein
MSNTKKDIQKLQRAIVDGLEDVKAQDIVVFDTENLSPLFERVIVASGTSNRQTKALAASVRDAVREAGFGKPRIEGEDNGEWIIVDCGAAVAHIMQPAIRQYYRLEELWGETPLRLKLGAPKPVAAPSAKAVKAAAKTAAKAVAKAAGKSATKPAGTTAAKKAPAKKAAAKSTDAPAVKKAPAKKVAAPKAAAPKAAAPKAAAKKVAAKKAAAPKTTAAKTTAAKTARPAVRKPAA